MSKSPADALFWYLRHAAIAPAPDDRVLFAGARPADSLADLATPGWTMVQPFKPFADALAASGFAVSPALTARGFDAAYILSSRQETEARGMLAEAALALQPDGWLVAAASSDAGGKRLPDAFAALGLACDTASKFHARIAATRVTASFDAATARAWVEAAAFRAVPATGMVSRPGLFAWDRLDQGSALLLECLPARLKGKGGDFGCGHGALAHAVLSRGDGVRSMLCMDADANAIEACRRNLAGFEPRAECRWADVTRDALPPRALDFVVMNPPFHEGERADLSVGLAFIEAARKALRKGGTLFLVANSHLPYEAAIAKSFYACRRLAERDGYKVYELTA